MSSENIAKTKNGQILVTGAGGFIGSYVMKALSLTHDRLMGLYRVVPSDKPSWKCIEGNLLDTNTQYRLKQTFIKTVIHCAAAVPSSFEGREAEEAGAANRKMDDFVAEFCLEQGARLIYISSTSIYGLKSNGKFYEETPAAPSGPYAIEKLYSEQLFSKVNSDTIFLRLCAPYGPEQKMTNVMKIFMERALDGKDLFYHGTGNRTQDFTYVGDIADAVAVAVNATANGTYNIAGGEPITMKALAKLIIRSIPRCKSRVLPSGDSDPQDEYIGSFDISKAARDLRWSPKTTLKEGVKKSLEALRGKQ